MLTGGTISKEAAIKAQCADKQFVQTQCVTPEQESLADQLQRRIARQSDDISTLYRAQDILRRHPEFEELAWLIRTGLV